MTIRSTIRIPILSDLLPDGFSFAYGESYLVRFDSSLWYQLSWTIAAQALKAEQKTQYHTFSMSPDKVKERLRDLGVDSQKLSRKELFRPIDDYVKLMQLPIQPVEGHTWGKQGTASPPLNDPAHIYTAIANTRNLLAKRPDEVAMDDKRWLHIDDDTSTYYNYYERGDVWRLLQNSTLPKMRFLENATLHSVMTDSWDSSFYATFESHCEGVIEIRSKEEKNQKVTYLRITSINGRDPKTGWRRIEVDHNGQASLDKESIEDRDLGFKKWVLGRG